MAKSTLAINRKVGRKDRKVFAAINGADCCCDGKPEFCWYQSFPCDSETCQGNICERGAEPAYVPCPIIDDLLNIGQCTTFQANGTCHTICRGGASGSPVVTTLPPNAVEITNIGTQYASCNACCCCHCNAGHFAVCALCPLDIGFNVSSLSTTTTECTAVDGCAFNNPSTVSLSIPRINNCTWQKLGNGCSILPPCTVTACILNATVSCTSSGWNASATIQFRCVDQNQFCNSCCTVPRSWTNTSGLCGCPPGGGWVLTGGSLPCGGAPVLTITSV